MKKQMVNLIRCLALFAIVMQTVYAADGQLYMTGKLAPLGASSSQGKGQLGVYLRWDIIEGELPNDVASLRLEKNQQELFTLPVNAIKTIAEIQQIYSATAEQQRLLQTISLLKNYALSKKPNYGQNGNINDFIPGVDFNASNFATELSRLLTTDDAWSKLISRQNFNIARARNRAYLDLNPGIDPTYVLSAIDALGTAVKIGEVVIDSNKSDGQLLAVTDFHQVEKSSCGIAENMADHNSVVLDWQPGGFNVTDIAASSIQRAGYLLYRTSTDFAGENLPQVDIANLAVALGHDQRGNSQIPGYELVETNLILSESAGDGLDNAAYVEVPAQVIAAGLKPGDRRGYYIVPVDFAGHLGETVGTIVRIPDRTSIAQPWNVAFKQTSGANPMAKLIWDASTIENYQAKFGDTRTFCNLGTAEAASGRIAFAYASGSCEEPHYTRIGITDGEYTVYRFDSFQSASLFSDRDVDGFNDSSESESAKCDATIPVLPNNADAYHKVTGVYSTIPLSNGRSKVVFQDDFLSLSENQSQVYWYRIVSKTTSNVSILSTPVKAVYYDTSAPAAPTFTAIIKGDCCDITKDVSAGESWKFTDTVNQADKISLAFENESTSQSAFVPLRDFGDAGSAICNDKSSPIFEYIGRESDKPSPRQRVLSYGEICSANIPNEMNLCKSEGWLLQKQACDIELVNGMVVDGEVEYLLQFPEGSCGSFLRDIGGVQSTVSSSCGTDEPGFLVVTVNAGECGVTTSQDSSGNISEPVQLPCSQAMVRTAPNPPQPIYLNVNATDVDFSWRLPLEPVAITLVELTSDINDGNKQASDRQTFSVPNAGFTPSREFIKNTPIHELLMARDQWCVRFKAVAPSPVGNRAALSSSWSQPICKTRRSNNSEDSIYLPWPKIKSLTVDSETLYAVAANDFYQPDGYKNERMPLIIPMHSLVSGQLLAGNKQCIVVEEVDDVPLFFAEAVYCIELLSTIQLSNYLTNELGLPFMMYRQARTTSGQVGQWVQVSPLIDKVNWEPDQINPAGETAFKLNDPYFNVTRINQSFDSRWGFSFIDRYPYIAGYSYRYQMVIFNQEHAIEKIYQTGWKQTDAALQNQQGANQ